MVRSHRAERSLIFVKALIEIVDSDNYGNGISVLATAGDRGLSRVRLDWEHILPVEQISFL